MRAHHHIFCGQRCRFLFLAQTLSTYLWTPFRATAHGARRFVQTFGLSHPLHLLLLGAILLLLFWSIQVRRDVEQLRSEMIAMRSAGTQNGDLLRKSDRLVVTQPTADAMVTVNRITIEGESEPNRIISLSSRNKVIAVTLAKKGRFRFQEIPVRRGRNRMEVRAIAPDGKVTVLQVLEFVYNNPTVAYLARDFTRGDPTRPRMALTFDGGSLANVTLEILDILAEKGVRSTMFLTGEYMTRFPDYVQRIVADGHEVGNHTWSHPHLTTFEENRTHLTRPEVTRDFLQQELRRAADFFQQLTGATMQPFWRAPFGEHNLEIREWAAELGYRHVGWTNGNSWEQSMDTLDWVADPASPAYHTASEIYDKILAAAQQPQGLNGAIILMHLGSLRNGDFPHQKLPGLIDQLRSMGYEFVPVSELIDR
jgi:peptidoglycan/xylan/chitin deacetylase (PgdA/CDA1 family)